MHYAVLAQLVEHSAVNRTVAGSSPADGAPNPLFLHVNSVFYKDGLELQVKNYLLMLYNKINRR